MVNTGMNFAILIGPLMLGILYPHVGKLAGIMGAVGGLFTIYLIPISTYVKHNIDHRCDSGNKNGGDADDDNYHRGDKHNDQQ